MAKYRIVKKDDEYVIELSMRDGVLFFGSKRWIEACIYNFDRDIIDDHTKYTKLAFKNEEDANFVYKYLCENNFLSNDCIDIIFKNNAVYRTV